MADMTSGFSVVHKYDQQQRLQQIKTSEKQRTGIMTHYA